MYGVIEWLSWRYPRKRYVAMCFSPEMFESVFKLVHAIADYHTVTAQVRLKH